MEIPTEVTARPPEQVEAELAAEMLVGVLIDAHDHGDWDLGQRTWYLVLNRYLDDTKPEPRVGNLIAALANVGASVCWLAERDGLIQRLREEREAVA